MFESIIYAFALCFILCGMIFLGLLLFDRLITPKEAENYCSIVPGFHGDKFLPSAVYAAYIRSNLFTFSKKNEVIVLDMGLDDSEKRDCENMLGEYVKIFFCTDKEIAQLFVERTKKK